MSARSSRTCFEPLRRSASEWRTLPPAARRRGIDMNVRIQSPHLTDAELFTLALPPAGEPEALPGHLLECAACGRALQTWKAAVRDLAREDAGPMGRRSERE